MDWGPRWEHLWRLAPAETAVWQGLSTADVHQCECERDSVCVSCNQGWESPWPGEIVEEMLSQSLPSCRFFSFPVVVVNEQVGKRWPTAADHPIIIIKSNISTLVSFVSPPPPTPPSSQGPFVVFSEWYKNYTCFAPQPLQMKWQMSDEQRSADAALLTSPPLTLHLSSPPLLPILTCFLPHYSSALLPPLILSYSSGLPPLCSALHPPLLLFFVLLSQWSVS